jgi:hypothetical protein
VPLIVDERGWLDRSSVASLSKDELRDWVAARLHGRDTLVPGDGRQGEYPHHLFASIYPELDRDSRSYIRDIVQEFLRDMARNENTTWRGGAAHALLLLAQRLHEREFIAPIREMAESGKFFVNHIEELSEDVHRRLLQSLVALDWKAPVEFWHEQFRLAPTRHAGVAIAGLRITDPQHAIDLLPHLPWDDESVQDQTRVALRGLLQVYPHSYIGELLTGIRPQLSVPVQGLIRRFLPEVSPFIRDGFQWDIRQVKNALEQHGYSDFRPKELSFTARM